MPISLETFGPDGRNNPVVRAAEFAHVLGRLSSVREFKTDFTPFEEPGRWAVNRFMAYEAVPNTLYLPSEVMTDWAGVLPAQIENSRILSSTRRKSQHALFFTKFVHGSSRIRLAVKPHEGGDGWRPAVNEQIMTRAFHDIGLCALRPMGVVLFDGDDMVDRISYSLTELHDGLTTFDSMDWRGYYDRRQTHPGMNKLWREAATATAAVHASGKVGHADLWARNFATSVTVPVMTIDQEHAVISETPPRDAEARYGLSYPDLLSVMKSVVFPYNFPGRPNEVGLNLIGDHYRVSWFEAFRDVFFDSYVADRKEMKATGGADYVDEELAQLTVDLRSAAMHLQEQYLDSV